jgi:hypothetical protein
VFYLAVVLKKGDIVGGRRAPQDLTELVVDLDRGWPRAMFEARACNPRLEVAIEFAFI